MHETKMKVPSCAKTGCYIDAVKLLVVEDNRKLASFLVRAFGEEGFTVDQVADGKVAIEQILAIDYDLVVLDHRRFLDRPPHHPPQAVPARQRL